MKNRDKNSTGRYNREKALRSTQNDFDHTLWLIQTNGQKGPGYTDEAIDSMIDELFNLQYIINLLNNQKKYRVQIETLYEWNEKIKEERDCLKEEHAHLVGKINRGELIEPQKTEIKQRVVRTNYSGNNDLARLLDAGWKFVNVVKKNNETYFIAEYILEKEVPIKEG